MSDDLAALAADAYIYGFPLIFDLQMAGGQAQMGMITPGPFNSFSHASRLAGPDDRFVSINNDTIYSIAQVNVSGGPVLLRVPDSAGRYYVLQFAGAWTNNFAYVGRRATGTAAGSFLLTPPGWEGNAPAGARVIEFPTKVATIVGRWACDGPARPGGGPGIAKRAGPRTVRCPGTGRGCPGTRRGSRRAGLRCRREAEDGNGPHRGRPGAGGQRLGAHLPHVRLQP